MTSPADPSSSGQPASTPRESSRMSLADVLGYMADHPAEFSPDEIAAKMREAALRIQSDAEALARAHNEVKLAIESLDRVKAATILAREKPAGRA